MSSNHTSDFPMNKKTAKFLSNIFAWDAGTIIFAAAFFVTFIAFNVLWCSWTTFTPFSHFPLYVSSLLFSLLLTLPYAIWRCRWVEILMLILLDFLLVANLMYARTYFAAIPLSSYGNAGNLADFLPSVWASISLADITFPLITIIAIWLSGKYINLSKPKTNIWGYLIVLSIPVIFTLIAFPTPTHFKEHYRKFANNAHAFQSTPAMYTIFGKIAYDGLTTMEKLTPQQQKATEKFLNSLPGVKPLPDGMKAPKNLVVIFCESLESWVIDFDYNGQAITPNINGWLKEATTFYDPHVLSQAKDGRSIDGQLLVLAGLLPLEQGTFATQYPDNYYPSIYQALKQAHNSRATLMTGDKEKVWNQGHIARGMGIDSIVSFPDFRLEDNFTGRRHIGDRALMKQVVEKLKKGDIWAINSPAYLQVVTYSGHGPFLLPDNEKKLKIETGTPEIVANYMNTAHYTDEALGILINYLKSRRDWSETMVVITGDHEGLASWRAEAVKNPLSRKYVSKEQYVPLIILNSPIAGRSEKIMGQVDIYSSLIQLLGLGDYKWHGLGQSIFDESHPGIAIGPDGRIVPANSKESAAREHEAWSVSNNIIRFNLLAPKSNY